MEKTPPMAKDDTTEDSSEDPKYRPPLAGGGNNSSRDEDSELNRPYSLSSDKDTGGKFAAGVIDTGSDGNGNWGWWADHEDNMTTIVKRTPTTPPIENKFIASEICPIKFPSDNYELCLGCKNMYTTSIYCKSCWKIKKYCLPPMRLKLSRSKIKAARQKRTEQRDNNRIRHK